MSGWIKLHRKLIDNPIFRNQNLLQVWIYCLLNASYNGGEVLLGHQTVILEPGEFITGRHKGARETGLSPSTFERSLKTLENLEYIERKVNSKCTVVKVIKWGVYQGLDSESEQQMNSKRTANEQQMNTYKKVKESKEGKELKERRNYSDESLHLAETLQKAILNRDPETKVPDDLTNWAVEADRMIRLDKREPGEAVELIAWCQQDSFWSANILSMAKFRKQYDKLKRQRERYNSPRDQPKGVVKREYTEADFLGYKFN